MKYILSFKIIRSCSEKKKKKRILKKDVQNATKALAM